MNNKLKLSFAVFLSIMLFISCKHEPILPDNLSNGNNGGGGGNNGICFESQILPILNSNCAVPGCHNAQSAEEGIVLESYASLMGSDIVEPNNPVGSKLIKFITENDPDKIMPPPPRPALSTSQIALISQWIAEGALNTTNCGVVCNENIFTYSGAVVPIMNTYCKGCHSAPYGSGGINLDTYLSVKAVAETNNKLLGSIKHLNGYSAMPKNQNKLSDCQILQIQKWYDNGMLNN